MEKSILFGINTFKNVTYWNRDSLQIAVLFQELINILCDDLRKKKIKC